MWASVRSILDSTHVVALLIGMLVAAGVAWGRGQTQIADHDRRLGVVELMLDKKLSDAEASRHEEQRELRSEMARRFDRLEDRINRIR